MQEEVVLIHKAQVAVPGFTSFWFNFTSAYLHVQSILSQALVLKPFDSM